LKKLKFILMLVLLINCSLLNELNKLPTSEINPRNEIHIYSFPLDLYCSDVIEGTGSNWGHITIGSSTVEDLVDTMFQYSEKYSVDFDDNEVRFSMFDRTQVNDDAPLSVKACVAENVIVALVINHNLKDLTNLVDYVAEYGEPNAITWTDFETSRLAFWFEKGLAADVGVASDGFGAIIQTVYMPYQETVKNFV
jgi:hypothetical protein